MKRFFISVTVILFILQAGFAQSKVAVLDASLGEGVHPNAAAIVADTINEQFVKSPEFIAIDRAYISNIQAEKQFQLSGEVADQDIKELGATFGADYLCIANVSLLGSTYTVSARLIEVASAQVVAQESDRQQGEIDVLFDIAEVVGSKFVGSYIPSKTDAVAEEPAAVTQPEQTGKVAPAPKPAAEKWKPKKRITFGYMFPGYMGDTGNDTYWGDDYYPFYEQDRYALDLDYDDAYTDSLGIDVHILMPLGLLYWSFGAGYTKHSLTAEYYDWSTYIDYEYEYDIFSTVDVSTGAGLIFSPVSHLQMYAGAYVGYMLFTLGSDYGGDATDSYWTNSGESATGLSFGGEIGGDFFLGNLCAGLKYKLSIAGDLTGDNTFTDEYQDESGGDTSFGVHGLSINLGYSW